MHALSALPAEPRTSSRRVVAPRHRGATTVGPLLTAESIGHLVPRTGWAGRVHSVFARHCNLACRDLLLTLCRAPATDGPTVIRLTEDAPADLRQWFVAGEPVSAGQDALRTPRAELRWRHARRWWPAAPRPSLPAAGIVANLRHAEQALARCRSTRHSVIDGPAAPVAAALQQACLALDSAAARPLISRLVGWGEGLTPAGDDFLVGLMAGLDAMPTAASTGRSLCAAVASTVRADTQRTSPIAAHCLRLAAAGHHTAPLLELRQALLADEDRGAVDDAMRTALSIGATSGADTVSGLLAGLAAWAVPAELDRR